MGLPGLVVLFIIPLISQLGSPAAGASLSPKILDSTCVFSATHFPQHLPLRCRQPGDVIGVSISEPCDFDQVNLGIGDVSGIGHLYGTVN